MMSPDERKTPARHWTCTNLRVVLQALAPKRQETDASGPALKAVSYALGCLLLAVIGFAFWLGVTLSEMGVSIENNAMAIARLERGQERLETKVKSGQERLESGLERLENLLFEFLRQRNGDECRVQTSGRLPLGARPASFCISFYKRWRGGGHATGFG